MAYGSHQARAEYRAAAVCRGTVTAGYSASGIRAQHGAVPAYSNELNSEDTIMQIILQEDVEKLGTRGQVVDVANGYARNFLLPRNLGIEATPGNLKRLEKMRATFAKKEATEKEAAQKLAELLSAVSLSITRKAGENDQLFGSVTTGDIADALALQGYQIEKRKIVLADPVKVIGEYQIPIKLHREITSTVKLTVSKEG
jgi:large subunit ribosomal protein L9